ncbi:NAD(P)-dependent dehydrogenase (short-subunit alcohol dehydrogenase family) [Paraburkholderia sp. JPY465]|uniref:SDR family NAD(P)-dependent oxidoreductase n=1 Tax=Paraburkholderia sp. JPY465 TaxID=3042285 RepID=UPI003D1F86E1
MTERIAFVTGGNKGLGLETARRLKDMGFRVYIGARESGRGMEAASRLNVEWLQLDVTDEASVRDATARLRERESRLDVLINNAGIAGSRKPAAELTGEDAESVFATNVVGPVRVMNAFIPLMETSTNPIIVNVSSGLGSFAVTQDPQRFESQVRLPLYCASKSALTMLTVQYARALPNFRINAADPGYTSTDFNAHRGLQTVEEGTDAIIHLATLPPEGPTGTFVDRHGVVPW